MRELEGMPRAPRDWIPHAVYVIENDAAARELADSDPVWARDQLAAAIAEVHSTLPAGAVTVESDAAVTGPEPLALHLCLSALAERQPYRCEHAIEGASVPLFVLPAIGITSCVRHVGELHQTHHSLIEPGRCPVCGEPADELEVFRFVVGHLTIAGAYCDTCSDFAGYAALVARGDG